MNLREAKQSAPSQTVTQRTATSIPVEIRGQKFAVKTDKDPKHVAKLAQFIDGKAAEIQAAAPGVPMDRLMMLVGMMVAEELFESQTALARTRDDLKRAVDACLSTLDEAERES